MNKTAICLWFDGQAEQAADFYLSVFKKSKKGKVARYTEVGPGKEGSVLTVEFTLNELNFLALNGGPEYKFNPAVSVTVYCKTQKEIDHYWEKLTEGGMEVQCGWLTDKFGLSWQIVPEVLPALVASKDKKKADRVIRAIFGMKKFDIAALKRASKGE